MQAPRGIAARAERDEEGQQVLVSRVILDRVRRALAIVQKIIKAASDDLLVHPVGEGLDPRQRRSLRRMAP